MKFTPPRLAIVLLTLRLRAEWRDFIVGDLVEEFQKRSEVSPAQARKWFWRQALRCLVAPVKSRAYALEPSIATAGDRSFVWTIVEDLRYGVRMLRRAPALAVAVIGVLALGIGANTAIFSMVNSVLLRPLPFHDSDRLVRLFHVPPQDAFPGMKTFSVSPANFYDWKHDAQSFDGMAIYRSSQFVLTGGDTAEAVIAAAVGGDFFEVVGTQPLFGRVFFPEEDSPGRNHVVVLSEAFWKSRFAGARDVTSRALMLNGEPYQIVGVMPEAFSLKAWRATAFPIWVPLAYTGEQRAIRDNHNAAVIARLKPGVTEAQAQAEMNAISRRLEQQYPKENAGWGATIISLKELIVGDIRLPLLMVLVAVGLVLLIACANVGNLLFARALTRRKELAIRSALGARRGRVFQQLLIESLVLALLGGVVGLLIARAGLSWSGTLLDREIPRADEITTDWRVLVFCLGVSILTGILAGALPALRAGRTDLNSALREGGRTEGAVGVRTRRALVICEVAMSVVLLMGAGVMGRTVSILHRVDAGFDPENVLTLLVNLPNTRYKTAAAQSQFFDEALQRLRTLPGVENASAVDDLPSTGGSVQPLVIEGKAELLPRDQPTVEVRKVLPQYFATMRIPIVRGRDVRENDTEVMLVSQSAAKLLWGDVDPIGRHATLPLQSRTVVKEVIGIVGDVKQGELTEAAAPTVYEYTRERAWGGLAIVLRASSSPLAKAEPARQVIRAIDPQQPVEEVRTMTSILEDTMSARRFSATLLAVFAAVALTLAAVGIYSVLAYVVRGRAREIGIRTALGAQSGDVVRLVLREGMTPVLIGIVIGAAGALASARALRTMVFGVSATDPLTLGSVAAALAIVALIASLLPARRAARLDPLKVLRN